MYFIIKEAINIATLYSDVNEVFLSKITDFILGDMLDSTPNFTIAENRMLRWMKSAIIKFPNCKHDLTDRNDTTKTFNITLTEFEIEVIAMFMCYEWAQPEIQNLLNLRQILGDAAFKLTSQANHLKEIRAFKNETFTDAQYMMVSYSYITSDPTLTTTNNLRDLG